MKDTQFDTFMDFLKVNPCNSRQTEILIALNFFSEFGKSGKLMEIFNFYQDRFDKDRFKRQIKKDKNPYPIEIISKYSKETEKQYNIQDVEGFCTEIISSFENKELPVKEQLKAQSEYLGYINYTNEKAKGYYYIIDVDTKYSPKLSAYNIQSGETIYLKINKGKYYADPERVIKAEDIIRAVTEPKNKKRKTDKGWETLDETEEWITQYKIV